MTIFAAGPENEFFKNFVADLRAGDAVVFAGAGLSRPAGFVDWKGLMRDLANDLGLDVEKESDLVALAQYHVNHHGGRGQINRTIIEEFTKEAKLTTNHRLLARMPIHSVWTTNYDTLIEDAFKEARKRVDTKIGPQNLTVNTPRRDVTIYKMHGDVSAPDEAVITKDDYETYEAKRQLFSDKLKGDLVSKTFLFLGFSFTDPNIDYILARIRPLVGQNARHHYCIMRRPQRPAGGDGAALAQYEYESKKLDLRTADLKRYGIQALLIDDYAAITRCLEHLAKLARREQVFVSGSCVDWQPLGRPCPGSC